MARRSEYRSAARGWGLPFGLVLGMLWLGLIAGPVAVAEDDTPLDLMKAIEALEDEAADRRLLSAEDAEHRFEDALFAFMVADYEVAAERTYAVRPFLEPGPVRHEADHVLATSLVHIGATTLAQRVNTEILRDPSHPFARDAAAAQITLYGAHRSATEFADLYDQLHDAGLLEQASGALAYAIGRAHWHRGHLDDAASAFALVQAEELAYDRAQYHLGVIQVARGDLASALARFEALRTAPMTELSIAELATLAVARIAYEEARYDDAVALYRMFDPASPRRGAALEELAWTELRRGDTPAATLVLEERLRTVDGAPAPEVEVALGRLHLRLGDAEPAEISFTSAIGGFEEALDAASRLHLDSSLSEQVTGTSPEVAEADAWALRQLRADPRVTRAAATVEVAKRADEALFEAKEALRLLRGRLRDDPSTLRDKRLLGRATELLMTVARAHVDTAAEQVRNGSGRDERGRRQAIAKARDALETTARTLARMGDLHSVRSTEAVLAVLVMAKAARPTGTDGPLGVAEQRLRHVISVVRAQVKARDGPVQACLETESVDLARLEAAARVVGAHAQATWGRARALGTEAVMAAVDHHLQSARSGLADASWERLSELRETQQTLVDEQTRAVTDLERLFELIRRRNR